MITKVIKAKNIREKYTDRVPVILVPVRNTISQDKKPLKFLVPKELSFGQFAATVRKHLNASTSGLYFFIGNSKSIPMSNTLMAVIDLEYSSSNDYLYIYYDVEASFGF